MILARGIKYYKCYSYLAHIYRIISKKIGPAYRTLFTVFFFASKVRDSCNYISKRKKENKLVNTILENIDLFLNTIHLLICYIV